MANEASKLDLLLVKLDETGTKLDGLRNVLQQFVREEVDRQLNEHNAEGAGGNGTV